MDHTLPVMICGGSLAGLACAIRLKQLGIQALVLEQSQFPREKLCGEFLGPDALECLEQLGILDQVRSQAYGPVETIRFYNRRGKELKIQTHWLGKSYPFGLAIPRSQLDHLLLEAARKSGVQVSEKSRVLFCEREEDRFKLLVKRETYTESYYCQFFVDASGRNTRFFKGIGIAKNTMVGLQCHARLPRNNTSKELGMFLFNGGYGGIQPISKRLVNICMLLRPELARNANSGMDALLDVSLRNNTVAARLLENVELEGKIRSTSVTNLDLNTIDRPLLHIGDAMVTVDPFIGLGMAHALKTGYLSADHLYHGLSNGKTYSKVTYSYYRAYQKMYSTRLNLTRLLRPAFMSSSFQCALWPVLPPFLPLLAKLYQ